MPDQPPAQATSRPTGSRRAPGLSAGLLALALLVVGSSLTMDRGDAALMVAPASTAVPTVTATPVAIPVPSPAATPSVTASPSPKTSAVTRKPTSKKKRTSLQRATGRRADGSAVRVPRHGSGDFARAHRRHRTSAERGRLIRFDVAVEKNLAINPDQAALLIAATLDDRRSWRGLGLGRFTLVKAGAKADVHAYIATPDTTDRLCRPYRTLGRVSCQNGRRVVLNARRWVHGSRTFGKDRAAYRRYLVNHEFGHALGRRHVRCPSHGRPAPVMVQQTKGLGGCRPNPWPKRTKG